MKARAYLVAETTSAVNCLAFTRAVAYVMSVCPRVGDKNVAHLIRDVIRESYGSSRLTRRELARRLLSTHPDIDEPSAHIIARLLFPTTQTT